MARQVFRAVHISSQQEVAIKDISQEKLTLKLQENLESEISILKNHAHRNIVKLYDIQVGYTRRPYPPRRRPAQGRRASQPAGRGVSE